MAGTEKLQAFIEAKRIAAEMRRLAQRWQAAGKKDVAVTLTLAVTIDGQVIPASDMAPLNRALAERVRVGLGPLIQQAVTQLDADALAARTAAKAEYDQLFV